MDFDSFFVKESSILSLYIIGKREPSVSALQQEGPAMPRKGSYVKKSDQPGYVETRGGAGKPSPKRYTIDTPLNDKQERFVKELISKDGQITQVEAAINAVPGRTGREIRRHVSATPERPSGYPRPRPAKWSLQRRRASREKPGHGPRRYLREQKRSSPWFYRQHVEGRSS